MLRFPTLSPKLPAITLALLVAACSGGSYISDELSASDIVFRNGYVYTQDARESIAQAVVVNNGRIAFIGKDSEVQQFIGSKTQVIDLGGRMLMPGLVDGHLHALEGGAQALSCNLNYASLTVAQFRTLIQACLDASKDKGPDVWLKVVNWDRQAMNAVDRDPTRADLDSLQTARPILVRSIDFHTRLANSKAMSAAGITRATQAPAGGAIGHTADGELSGMFEDNAAFLLDDKVPAPTDAEQVLSAKKALDEIRQQGVTTFMSALASEAEIKAFHTIQKEGTLTARALFATPVSPEAATANPAAAVAQLKTMLAKYDQGPLVAAPGIGARHVKMFADGVLQAPAQSAVLLQPYWVNKGTEAHPNWQQGTVTGETYFPPAVLKPLVKEIVKAGLDPHIHAIGDRTVREALDAIEGARAQYGANFRPSIAHVELADPADYGRFKSLDVTPVMSFQWAQQAPYSMEAVKEQLGPVRYERMEPEGSLHNAGARVAYGSDWPIDPFAEFLALKIGVTRKGDPEHPASFGPNYAGRLNGDALLPRNVALRAITMNSAFHLGLERSVGSIESGKLADMIVLDQNFMQVDEARLGRTKVLLTMVGGKIVYGSAQFPATAAAKSAAAPAGLVERVRAAVMRGFVGHKHD